MEKKQNGEWLEKLKPEEWFKNKMITDTLKYKDKYGFDAGKNGNSTWNNEADAFKHAYMQWWLTNKFSPEIAKKLGDAHETDLENNPSGEENMDRWNNSIGREVFHEMANNKNYLHTVSDIDRCNESIRPNYYYDNLRIKSKRPFSKENYNDEAAERIMEKMHKGDLITSPDDRRSFKNMELERLTDKDRVYYDGEFKNLKEKNKAIVLENYLDQAIENDWKIPHRKNLDKRVSSGELIYVDDYTRSDGSKMRGYYKRRPIK